MKALRGFAIALIVLLLASCVTQPALALPQIHNAAQAETALLFTIQTVKTAMDDVESLHTQGLIDDEAYSYLCAREKDFKHLALLAWDGVKLWRLFGDRTMFDKQYAAARTAASAVTGE